jgi:large subunit ribosomal protein L6
MSKIGRKPIDISGINVEIKNRNISYKGPKGSGVYSLSDSFTPVVESSKLTLVPTKEAQGGLKARDLNREWGMHRALLSNALLGSRDEFEKIVEINGLGYKAVQSGDKLVFSLGYSHKIDFALPKGVTVSLDKTGQKLALKSANKEMLGEVCDKICDLRRPEPYKGTGIKVSTDVIVRKAGKTK